MAKSQRLSWLNRWPQVPTPLGQLVEAGFASDSRGTGIETFRDYPCHALVLSVRGKALYREPGGVSHDLIPGDCLWIAPGVAHQYGAVAGGTWDEIYLSFRGDIFSKWSSAQGRTDCRIQHLGDVALWFPRWISIAQSHPRGFSQAVTLLGQIHFLINDIFRTEVLGKTFEERLEASRLRLESWPAAQAPDLYQIARECGCGYDKWRRAFLEKYGIPPGRYRRRTQMDDAARLMLRSNLTNEELAAHFGSADGFHFSKLFKQAHGISPSQFRAKRGGT